MNTIRHIRRIAGFTLVELLVVITILVIIGSIAFFSLEWHLLSARDAVRVNDLSNISQGLDLTLIANGSLPHPDNNVITLFASGSPVGYQGTVGEMVTRILKINGVLSDPYDKKPYTYIINNNNTRYQLLTLFEDGSGAVLNMAQSTFWIDLSYAATTWYVKRIPGTKWSALGVFLGNTPTTINTPIQELYDVASFTGVDMITSPGNLYKAYVSKNRIITGTGVVFSEVWGRLDSSVGTYPGCDTPNIKLPNGMIWAACNIGATTAWREGEFVFNTPGMTGSVTDYNQNLRYTLGSYFQWGRNEDVTNLGTGSIKAPTWSLATTILGIMPIPSLSPYDWITTQNHNLWGWSGTSSTMGLYSDRSNDNKQLMQGPCAMGYHVPTTREWALSITSIDPTVTSPYTSSYTGTKMPRNILRIPLSGRKSDIDGTFAYQWTRCNYWSSTNSSTIYGRTVTFYPPWREIVVIDADERTRWNPVRCMKNY